MMAEPSSIDSNPILDIFGAFDAVMWLSIADGAMMGSGHSFTTATSVSLVRHYDNAVFGVKENVRLLRAYATAVAAFLPCKLATSCTGAGTPTPNL
jgi:hypothetical protein